jgi:LysR family transcriptional activator of nhaA
MLNYKQLYYFWNVAKAGSITRAAERLHSSTMPFR